MSVAPRRINSSSDAHDIWIHGKSEDQSLNILLTVSQRDGESTYLITDGEVLQTNAQLFVAAPPERVLSPKKIQYIRVTSAFKIFGYLLTSILISFSVLSFSNVTKARIVLTGSMSPTIKPGDVIITIPPKYKFPKKGDIVAYTARRFNGASVATISHRIIGGDSATGFVVKGDRNPSPDVQHPKLNDIQGVVVLIIPFIGNLLTPKALFLIVPGLIGVWLLLDSLKNEE